ncbi:putative phage tail assembly chaperone [Yersinia ruckeri]|uniref:putative phage tail assembly chaperone n=1 Tax=Yersinia TaxID=629 RepID=UPI0008FE135E|nr:MULTISPECIES: putative phage tail assembly chaperone [Yersinia]EKN4181785.1 putative phage tail assembly chaperone [Yersinia ruckeri]EKN4206949.1 putative phage tail assembly chaperone [Yersinia ruckeri]EKN4704488.1 putative phage tail assembly chaperone [Yersinia ruckeri]MCK8554472.1 putative phage tail assembly chaperone [Yersinia ruckeri]MCK8585538.1 putative phage tail assembly chaperone [Yersinia ruckeri]
MADKHKITLTVNGVDITFEPNTTAYNSFINDMAMDNKIAPAFQYLRRIVNKDNKEALDDILKVPGAALQLAGKINEVYAPQLEIEVKN